MFEHGELSLSQFRTCQVNADEFELYEGDPLQPGSEIGIDINSGVLIYACDRGYVAAMSDSFMVKVYQETRAESRLSRI